MIGEYPACLPHFRHRGSWRRITGICEGIDNTLGDGRCCTLTWFIPDLILQRFGSLLRRFTSLITGQGVILYRIPPHLRARHRTARAVSGHAARQARCQRAQR